MQKHGPPALLSLPFLSLSNPLVLLLGLVPPLLGSPYSSPAVAMLDGAVGLG